MAYERKRVDTYDVNLAFKAGNVFDPNTRARMFAKWADETIKAVDHFNDTNAGRDISYDVWVDGKKSTNFNFVRDGSKILAEWELRAEVIDWIWDLLKRVGPHGITGRYHSQIFVYADDKPITKPEEAIGAKTVMFLSGVPYARKIERGKKGYAPGHVYESVAAMAKGRFGNIALIKYTYAEPVGATPVLDAWAQRNAYRTGQSRNKIMKRVMKNRRNPAVVVYL